MIVRKALIAMASAGLVFGSTAAVAAPAAEVRTASPTAEAEEIGGFAWIIALVVAAGVVAVVASDDDDDEPVSP